MKCLLLLLSCLGATMASRHLLQAGPNPIHLSVANLTTAYQIRVIVILNASYSEELQQRYKQALAGQGNENRIATFSLQQGELLVVLADVYYVNAEQVNTALTTADGMRAVLAAHNLVFVSLYQTNTYCPQPPPGTLLTSPGSCALQCAEHMSHQNDSTCACDVGYTRDWHPKCFLDSNSIDLGKCPVGTVQCTSETTYWKTNQYVNVTFSVPTLVKSNYGLAVSLALHRDLTSESFPQETLSFGYDGSDIYMMPSNDMQMVTQDVLQSEYFVYEAATRTVTVRQNQHFRLLEMTVSRVGMQFEFSYASASEAFTCISSTSAQENTTSAQQNTTSAQQNTTSAQQNTTAKAITNATLMHVNSANSTTDYRLRILFWLQAPPDFSEELQLHCKQALAGQGNEGRVAIWFHQTNTWLQIFADVYLDSAALADEASVTTDNLRAALATHGLSCISMQIQGSYCPPPPPGAFPTS